MLRKAANGKEENLMAFQGKQRNLYYLLIHLKSVLTLMVCNAIMRGYTN